MKRYAMLTLIPMTVYLLSHETTTPSSCASHLRLERCTSIKMTKLVEGSRNVTLSTARIWAILRAHVYWWDPGTSTVESDYKWTKQHLQALR